MKTKTASETQIVGTIIKFSVKNKSQRAHLIESQLLHLLDGAEGHDEIKKALPKCKDFFKSLKSEEFVSLMNETASDAVYIALWYHYGETMHKAINKCALATKERMALLYPLFRLYADESDTYI